MSDVRTAEGSAPSRVVGRYEILREVGLRKGTRRLYLMNADGSHVRALTHGSFDMSPDWYRG